MTRHIFIFWAPVMAHWERMRDELLIGWMTSQHVVFGTWELAGFASYIHDIYASDDSQIARKAEILLDHPPFLLAVEADVEDPTAVKEHLRELLDPYVPRDLFVTCHASATPAEAAYLSAVLGHENRELARRRRSALPRPTFRAWIRELKAWLAETGIDPADVCVVGSGALEAAEIRTATDLDITVTAEVRHRLFGPEHRRLTEHVDLVSEGYHARVPGGVSDDELIRDHSFIRLGLRFAKPSIIRERKAHEERMKDSCDVHLIDRWQRLP